jgi:predicted Zn-dependent peptidase
VSYEELVSKLQQVTVDEVVAVASDIFKDGTVSLSTLGPIKEDDLDTSNLHF